MKVLFAVSNENISEAIIKRYKENFNELITYKNVYYFNAVIKELQNNYTYDRIVISEDLEVFSSSNELSIDKFLLNKLSRIKDEGKDYQGNSIPVIFISSEKRKFGTDQLKEYYSLGLYDALIGNDRTITKICNLIKNPRTKEEALKYYQIEIDSDENVQDNDPVSSTEIKNILRFYRGIASTPERFSSTFDRIVVQYNDEQLRYIIQKLPMTVKIILEQQNQNYRNLMSGKSANSKIVIANEVKNVEPQQNKTVNENQKRPDINTDIPNMMLNENNSQIEQTGINEKELPNINTQQNNVMNGQEIKQDNLKQSENLSNPIEPVEPNTNFAENINQNPNQNQGINENIELDTHNINEDMTTMEEVKMGNNNEFNNSVIQEKNVIANQTLGIPLNNQQINFDNDVLENKIDELSVEENNIKENSNNVEESDELISPDILNEYRRQIEDTKIDIDNLKSNPLTNSSDSEKSIIESEPLEEVNVDIDIDNIKHNSTKDKKTYKIPNLDGYKNAGKRIITFVGTSKNGTSFIVNSVSVLLSSVGVKTAILDMTTNRNSYYLATASDKDLKAKTSKCFEKLEQGELDGIEISKTLTVFTSEPDNGKVYSDAENMYKTLLEEYDLILVDTDFNTNFGFFAGATEIYTVQSLDILTMQPLTRFLKELKDENLLTEDKIKVIINKEMPLKGISRKVIVGGISTYNNPSMSYMTKLFDRDKVTVCSLPFDQTVYQKYLENIVYCKYDISGYPKKFIEDLKILSGLIYPEYKSGASIQKENENRVMSELGIKEGVFHKVENKVDNNSLNNRNIQNVQNIGNIAGNNQSNVNINPNQNLNINQNSNNIHTPGVNDINQAKINNNVNQNPNGMQGNMNMSSNRGFAGGFYGFKHRENGQNYQINTNQPFNNFNYETQFRYANNQQENMNSYNLSQSQNSDNPYINNNLNGPYQNMTLQDNRYNSGQQPNPYQNYAEAQRNTNMYNTPNVNSYGQNGFQNYAGNNVNALKTNKEKSRFSNKVSESLNKMKNFFK